MTIEQCIICKELAKKSHHIIPHRQKLTNGLKTYLCKDCHKILHKAEVMGLCKLPSSEEEYRSWKSKMKELSTEEKLKESCNENF